MKKIILILFILSHQIVYACDICGCATGSYYLGLLPEYNKQFVGIRNQNKALTTHLSAEGKKTPFTSYETYNTTEIWGATNIGERWRIMGILPINLIKKETPGKLENSNIQGIGDLLLMSNYKIIDNRKSSEKFVNHTIFGGLGIKIPTGNYKSENVNNKDPNYFQLGTGSIDYLLNLSYDLRIMDKGINVNISYKINTENNEEYKYANKFSATIIGYHKFLIANKVRLTPNVGLNYESQGKDQIYKQYPVYISGGNLFGGIIGIETQIKKWGIGLNYQKPIYQYLAEKRILTKDKWQISMSYLL